MVGGQIDVEAQNPVITERNEPELHEKTLNITGATDEADVAPTSKEGSDPGLVQSQGTEKIMYPSKKDPSTFPDGGPEAWLVVAGAFCGVFCSFGWINSIGVFQAYYETHQLENYNPSTVSWIPSAEVFMMFAWGPIFGRLYDSHGPRWILLAGSFLHVFGLMMTSISKQYYQIFLAQGVVSAIGTSAIFYSSMSAVGTWFQMRRAFAFGIMVSGASLGGITLPIMVSHLVTSQGFGWAMRISAFLILGLLVLANLTVKSRLPPRPQQFSILDFIVPFKELPFSLIAVGSFVIYLGALLPLNYIILYAQHSGMSADLSGYLIPILSAASIFGRILPGYIGDRYGRINVLIVSTTIAGILSPALWLPAHSNAPIIVFSACYGFASGGAFSMLPAVIAQISDIHKIGVRNGTLYAAVSIASLIGNPIGGALITREGGGYAGLQIFSGCAMLGGVGVLVCARIALVGFVVKVKV